MVGMHSGADVLYDLPLPFNPPDELPVEDLPTLTIQVCLLVCLTETKQQKYIQ